MKNHTSILILIFLMFSFFTKAQTDSSLNSPSDSLKDQKFDNEKIYSMVEQMPSFPGGEAELFRFLQDINYPKEARTKKVSGRIFVTFVVNKEGKLKDAKILRGLGYGIDEEVMRVINKMPDWIPGKQNGKNVSVQFNLPVNFNLY